MSGAAFAPWWAGAVGLAAVSVGYWVVFGRLLGTSGKLTAIVDAARARLGRRGGGADDGGELSEAELRALLEQATRAEFGADAEAPSSAPAKAPRFERRPPRTLDCALFLVGIAGGAALATALFGPRATHTWLTARAGDGAGLAALLVAGGALVGFGTRMAGGCTSGHGLAGVSRLELRGLLATASFFGAAVLLSLAVGRWW